MTIVKAIFKILVGSVFGLLTALALSPALAAFNSGSNSYSSVAVPVIVMLIVVFALLAPSIRRAFGRGFLLAGVSFLALPLSTMLLSGRAAHDVINSTEVANQGAAALGAGIAGVAMTGLATFLGLIIGTVFIILGLVLALGGRREVIVVNQRL